MQNHLCTRHGVDAMGRNSGRVGLPCRRLRPNATEPGGLPSWGSVPSVTRSVFKLQVLIEITLCVSYKFKQRKERILFKPDQPC